MISLKKVTMDNFKQIITLKLNEHDKKMVAHNMYSLAEAYADQVSICRGIYADETLVGFIMYDYNQKENRGYISRLMIDQEHQRKGYGRSGLILALKHLRTFSGINEIQISYHPDNIKARTLYLDLGFVENGEVVDGETVAILKID